MQKILEIVCTGMKEGERFPVENTGRGSDLSPEFVIKNVSPDARTFLITLEDLSHPIKNFTHWVIWNIPADAAVLQPDQASGAAEKSGPETADISMESPMTCVIPGAIPSGETVESLGGAVQGIGYGFHRYAGPKPPRGKSHKYCFTVYALDCSLDLKASATKRKVLKKAAGHILQKGIVSGYFE